MRRISKLPRPRAADLDIVTIGAGLDVCVYRPPSARETRPALLWMHGGGYVLGDAWLEHRTSRYFADALGITVISVDYRLAPEHPYPAALDDCEAALRWLAAQPAVDTTRIAVGGMSAGGGLAAALTLRVRDHPNGIKLCHQLLVYPMLDDRSAPPIWQARNFRLWNNKSNQFAWAAYLGGQDPAQVAPGRCADLSGLPPAWIGVGTLDLFHAEDVTYAARLRAAGVPCELVEVPGAFHAFDAIRFKTVVAQSFLARQVASLRKAFSLD